MKAPPPISLDAELAAFLQGGVSMALATRDARMRPNVARVVGCLVEDGGVTLLTPGAQAEQVRADITANGMVAAVFSKPSTHRTVQLKGTDARIVPVLPAHHALVRAYSRIFIGELPEVSMGAPQLESEMTRNLEDLVAVRFTPTAAFNQTPGPRAGEPLERAR